MCNFVCVHLTLKTSAWSKRDTRTRLLGAYSWAGWSTSGLSSSSASLGSPFCSWTHRQWIKPLQAASRITTLQITNIRWPIYKRSNIWSTIIHFITPPISTVASGYIISACARHKPAGSPRTPRRWSRRSNTARSWCLWELTQRKTEAFSLEPAAIHWADRTERDTTKLKRWLHQIL